MFMRKNRLNKTLTAFSVIGCILSLTGCNLLKEAKTNEHICKDHLIKHDYKAPTCTEHGFIEYYHCDDENCGKNYKDSNATQLITDLKDLTIEELGHDFLEKYESNSAYHWHKCSRCDEITDHEVHVFNIEHATETQDKVCTKCAYVAETATGHICKNHLTKHDAVPATCTETGKAEYFECSCGKYYFDSNATQLVSDLNSLVITKLGHNFLDAFESDSDGHWHKCSRCDATTTHECHTFNIEHATEVLDKVCTKCAYVAETATGHICKNHLVKHDYKAPTCTEHGFIEYYHCKDCGKNYRDINATELIVNINDLTIEELGHDFLTKYESNSAHHWHKCSRCDEITGHEAHVFNIEHATETEDKVCTICAYVAETATGHICKNHLTKHDTVPATCTETGKAEYFECSCGKYYFDSNATQLVNDLNSLVITKLGHDFLDSFESDSDSHWHKCSRCDETTTHENHTFNIEHATETENKVCTVCDYIAEIATGHICKDHLIKHDAVSSTCTEPGNIEYYECLCGKYFKDANASELVTDVSSLIIGKLGHDMTHHNAKAATCTEDGNVEYWTCSRESGVYFGNVEGTIKLDSIVVPEHGHDMTHHSAKAATCTEDGNVEYWTCSHESGVYFGNPEGTKILDTIVDFKHGHDMTHHNAKAATCTEDGNVEYWTCSRESGVYYANEQGTETLGSIVIAKHGHDFLDAFEYDADSHWHKCSVCDETTTHENHTFNVEHATEVLDKVCTKCCYVAETATGHLCKNHLTKHDAVSATCTKSGYAEYYECSCGKWFKDANATDLITDKTSLVISPLGHDYSITVTEPHTTSTNLSPTGNLHQECSRCHESSDKQITTPYYWEENLTESIKPSSDTFNFIYTSDPHFDVDNASVLSSYYNYSTNLGLEIKRTAEYAGIDTVLITGDNSTSAAKPEASMRASLKFANDIYSTQLSGLNVLTTRGNHDGCYGTSYTTQMKPSEVNTLVAPHVSVSGTTLNAAETGGYYYVDYPSKKVRVISLNSYYVTDDDYGFKNQDTGRYGKEQLTWLANEALQFKDTGWSVILMTHTVNEFKAPVAEIKDQNVLLGILEAYCDCSTFTGSLTNPGVGTTYSYENLSVDFTENNTTANIIGLFSGHCHMDNINSSLASFPIFSIVSATNECKQMGTDGWVHSVGAFPNREKFTSTETAFDIVSVDLENKDIKCTRIGDGQGDVRSAKYYSSVLKESYSVTTDIASNINYTSSSSRVSEGKTFTANVTPKSYKYGIGDVTVKMGSTTLTDAYNPLTGDIIVNNVTDNISITVTEVSNNIFTMYQAGMKFSSSGTIDKSGNNIGTTTFIKAGYTGNNIAGPFKISVGDVFHLENMKMGVFSGCPDNGAMSIGISSSNEEYYLGATKGYIQCGTTGFYKGSGSVSGLEFSYEYGSDNCLTSITVLQLPSNIDLYIYLGYFSSSSGNPGIYKTHTA